MTPDFSFFPAPGAHIRDGRLLAVALLALFLCIAWLGVAAWFHRRNLRAAPVRIHVAGTRGKTTVTRMIAAGLRAGGMRVLAKTTGSEPRLVLPDGSEAAWPRRGLAAVREQARFFRQAARLRVDAVVVECMAIQPEMIHVSETQLVRATTTVITNARPDHFEDLGEADNAMADALVWATPEGGRMIVASEAASPGLRARAEARRCRMTIVETASLDVDEANRALALAACAAHGVQNEIAARAIDCMTGDPGQFFVKRLVVNGRAVRFANAFACNDVASFELLWKASPMGEASVVLFNARGDRPLRTRKFFEFLAALHPAPRVLVAGDRSALRLARRAGFASDAVRRLRAGAADAALAEAADFAGESRAIWGVGNFQGIGAAIVDEVNKRALSC